MTAFKKLYSIIFTELQRSTENYVYGITFEELQRTAFREYHSDNNVQKITFTKTFRELHLENNIQRITIRE